MKNRTILISLLLCLNSVLYAQKQKTISITSFGANGLDKVNDTEAFGKAAKYIQSEGGHVRLIIPKGIYYVGRDAVRKDSFAYGVNILTLKDVQNVTISGESGAIIRYVSGLKYGSYDPSTHKAVTTKAPFLKVPFARAIGCTFQFIDCRKITIENLELDGNNGALRKGGDWGDIGTQLRHDGVNVVRSKDITIRNMNIHHYALDAMAIGNPGNNGPDNILIESCTLSYNGRQGLSLIGGNGITCRNTKMQHTGRAGISSAPSAGLDIEAEGGRMNRNGLFENCEFINNAGCAVVADGGNSADMVFKQCTFWGVTTWSVWVNNPRFLFEDCNFYGSFVAGYITTNDADATRFVNCRFEDKMYQGKKVFGSYLLECNGRKKMHFENCSFTANLCKLIWYNGSGKYIPDELGTMNNCNLTFRYKGLANNAFLGVLCNMKLKNNTLNILTPSAKKHYLISKNNLDQGNNNWDVNKP
ncbi:MAG: right-handed parallel beta-helix repeat-containing protein [Chitinophagaceae bacterium]|nr:right-handed parallel beta-helix repeat-containing protein [Chitinophagaceae bacterium]